jgi:uncharacterized coiled-coil protein SlyX
MIFFKSKRIRDLEWQVNFQKGRIEDLQKDKWQLKRDIDLLADFLKVSFQDIRDRRVVKRGE